MISATVAGNSSASPEATCLAAEITGSRLRRCSAATATTDCRYIRNVRSADLARDPVERLDQAVVQDVTDYPVDRGCENALYSIDDTTESCDSPFSSPDRIVP